MTDGNTAGLSDVLATGAETGWSTTPPGYPQSGTPSASPPLARTGRAGSEWSSMMSSCTRQQTTAGSTGCLKKMQTCLELILWLKMDEYGFSLMNPLEIPFYILGGFFSTLAGSLN